MATKEELQVQAENKTACMCVHTYKHMHKYLTHTYDKWAFDQRVGLHKRARLT